MIKDKSLEVIWEKVEWSCEGLKVDVTDRRRRGERVDRERERERERGEQKKETSSLS